MENKSIKVKQQIIDNTEVVYDESIRTTFVESLQGIAIVGNSVRMNFAEHRYNHSTGEVKLYITTRLALPVDLFYSVVDIFNGVKDSLSAATPTEQPEKKDAE